MTEDIQLKRHKYDMKIEDIEYKEVDGIHSSYLVLKMSGKDFNIKLANSLRRASINNVPAYAIPKELITIKTNNAVAFDNDAMKLRLSQFPVLGVENDLYFLPEKYWAKDKTNYADPKREKHSSEKNIEFYVNEHNNSANIINITTNDLEVHVDGERIYPYDAENPLLLIELQPNNRFTCHMKAALGVGERDVIWTSARNAYYDEDEKDTKNNTLTFTIEGNNQSTEYQILVKTCKFMIKKYTDLKVNIEEKITKKEIAEEKIIYLKLDNEDHTLGEPLNYEFQDHPDILRSGLTQPDRLIKSILIKVETVDGHKSPLDAIVKCIDIVINKFHHIGSLLEEIVPKNTTKSKEIKTVKNKKK